MDGSNTNQFRQALVPESSVADDPGTCPNTRCRGRSVVVEGEYTRGFLRRLEDGAEQSKLPYPAFQEKVIAINCLSCETRYELRPDAEIADRADYMRVKLENAHLKGEMTVPPLPPTQIM